MRLLQILPAKPPCVRHVQTLEQDPEGIYVVVAQRNTTECDALDPEHAQDELDFIDTVAVGVHRHDLVALRHMRDELGAMQFPAVERCRSKDTHDVW